MTINAKPLRDLFQLGTMLRKRDQIVRAAHAAGVSKIEIAEVTGLTRPTVDRILARQRQADEDQADPERCPYCRFLVIPGVTPDAAGYKCKSGASCPYFGRHVEYAGPPQGHV